MVINRRTFNIKPGCMEDAIKLIKDTAAANSSLVKDGPIKLSTAVFGPFDVLAFEIEFENLDLYQKFWKMLNGTPMEQFFETWSTLIAGGGTNELWEVR